jgi:hypothetical protein
MDQTVDNTHPLFVMVAVGYSNEAGGPHGGSDQAL